MYSRFISKLVPLYIFLFSFFTISQFGKHFFFNFSYLSGIRIDYLAPTLYFVDILSLPLIFAVFFSIKNYFGAIKKWIRNNLVLLSFSLFLLLLNYIFSLSKPIWIYGFFRIIQFTTIFVFFREYGHKKYIYSHVIWGLLVGSCFELILSVLQLSARHSLQGEWYYLGERYFSIFTPGIAKAYFMGKEFLRPYGTFSHPNSLGGFYLLLYTFILTQKKITNYLLKSLLLFVSSALILISFSRSTIVVYIFINILYIFKNKITCKTCLLAKIAIAFVLILFAFNISGDLYSLQKRTDFFEKSLTIISQKPFTGVGIGSYLIAQHNFPQRFSTFFEQPVHNIFLLTIAQLGIPLSILLFTLMFRNIKVFLKNTYLFLPLICVVLTGSVDHYWITLQQNVLVLVIIFGILTKRYEETTSRD